VFACDPSLNLGSLTQIELDLRVPQAGDWDFLTIQN